MMMKLLRRWAHEFGDASGALREGAPSRPTAPLQT